MKEAYERGYLAHSRGYGKSLNPYYSKTQATCFYAWLAGWNDRDIGHKLDLMQFSDPVSSAERLIKMGKSHQEIQQQTGCAPSTISRVAKRIGLSRDNRQLKTTEVSLLMSDRPIYVIASKLGMSSEQVCQHRYKQRQRTLKQNLENLKL